MTTVSNNIIAKVEPAKLGVTFEVNDSKCLLICKDIIKKKESVTFDLSTYTVIWLGRLEVKKNVKILAKNFLLLGTIYSKESGHINIDGGDYLVHAGTVFSTGDEPPKSSNWVLKNPEIVTLFRKGVEARSGQTILEALKATKRQLKGKDFFEKGLGLQ